MAKPRPDKTAGTRKSEVVSIRLEPRLKYLAELAARKQRRSLSSYIEWAVQKGLEELDLELASTFLDLLDQLSLPVKNRQHQRTSVAMAEQAFHLWDSDEAYRVVRLGACFPQLLTHDEQEICKLVRENDFVWKPKFQTWQPDLRWAALILKQPIDWDRLRDCWPIFRDVARGARSPSELPGKKKSTPRQA
jgi:hypothetical protein